MVALNVDDIGATSEPEIYEGELTEDGGVRRLRGITIAEAVALRRNGTDVVVCGNDLATNRKLAASIEFQANGRWKRCTPHAKAGPKSLPHYQPATRGPEGHTFYETTHRKAIR